MLPRQHVLHLRSEREFFSQAKRETFRGATLYWKNAPGEKARVAVVVPASAVKKATARNALKRAARMVIYEHILSGDLEGKKCVVVVRRVGKTRGEIYAFLKQSLAHLLTKMRDRTH